MKFSIVVPLYNKEVYLAATLRSVLDQTLTDFEVIVVDDGSTDSGPALVEALSDERVRMVRQPNAGVSSARNLGVAVAEGEWIAFLDADDWHHPQYLATISATASAYPQAEIIATGFVTLADTPANWPPTWPHWTEVPKVELITDLPARWMKGPSLCTSAVCVRRSTLQDMQPCFPTGESHGEDLDLWFRLAERGAIALVQAPLMAYREHATNSLSQTHAFEMPPFLQRLRSRAQAGTMAPALRQSSFELVAQHQVTLARKAIAEGRRAQALHLLLRGRWAMRKGRWWVTAAVLFLPRQVLRGWERWRLSRQEAPRIFCIF